MAASEEKKKHQEEIDEIRGRQLALIKLLPVEDALTVLESTPISSEEEHDVVANLLQRQKLESHLKSVKGA